MDYSTAMSDSLRRIAPKPVAALLASVLGSTAVLSACTSGFPESLDGIVQTLAEQAGADEVAHLRVEREADGLRVHASFIQDDGTVEQFLKRPYEDTAASLGSPTPSVLLAGVPLTQLDLDALEQRLDEVPDCDAPRAEVVVLPGEHVAENVRCSTGGDPTGTLDGEPVPVIPAGDLEAAVEQMRADAEMLRAEQVGRVQVVMADDEVWTQFQIVEPQLETSGDDTCALLVTRAGGSFYPRCETPQGSDPVSALDPDVVFRIWEAEGSPAEGWWIELVGESWRAEGDAGSQRYAHDGEPI